MEGGIAMKTVGQLLSMKGSDVWKVSPEASVLDALKLMAEKNIGAVLVLDGDDLVGIFSERDYARKVILEGKTSRETQVSDIMTSELAFVQPGQSMEECMVLMTNERIRHLPVMEGGRLVGLISIGDVVKAVISEQEFLIEQLENYITRSR
jgi:CBS domain-containing protein